MRVRTILIYLAAAVAAIPVTQQTALARLTANRAEQQRINALTNEDDKQQARNALKPFQRLLRQGERPLDPGRI